MDSNKPLQQYITHTILSSQILFNIEYYYRKYVKQTKANMNIEFGVNRQMYYTFV